MATAITTPTTVQEPSGPAGAADTYRYQVTGSGRATVGYGTVSGSGVTSSSGTRTLPWPTTITVGCKIVHNGKVIADQTASGQFATVSCTGS